MKDNVELVNKQLKDEFEKNRNYFNLERYVMSELLSPIQDYENAIKIIKSNMNLISDLKLIYIGAYLSSECFQRDNEFLKMLNYNQFSRAGGQEPFCRWRNRDRETFY